MALNRNTSPILVEKKLIELLTSSASDPSRLELVQQHARNIPISYFISILNTFKTDEARVALIDIFFEALSKEENSRIFIEAIKLLEDDMFRFGIVCNYIRNCNINLKIEIIKAIFNTLKAEQNRYFLLVGCSDKINTDLIIELLPQLNHLHRWELVAQLAEEGKIHKNNMLSLAKPLDLPEDDSLEDRINFNVALNKLASTSSQCRVKHQHTGENLKIAAGQLVAHNFREAYRSGRVHPDELKNLTKIVELITRSIETKSNNMQPLLDQLKKHPIRIGEQRTKRIVLCAIATFICAALVAASIGLAVISFGVAAPLTIATITLATNVVTGAIAASTAPVVAGLACGSTLFAVSGRKQGLALEVDKFIAQRSAQP